MNNNLNQKLMKTTDQINALIYYYILINMRKLIKNYMNKLKNVELSSKLLKNKNY